MDWLFLIVFAGLVGVARVAYQQAKREITIIERDFSNGKDLGESAAAE